MSALTPPPAPPSPDETPYDGDPSAPPPEAPYVEPQDDADVAPEEASDEVKEHSSSGESRDTPLVPKFDPVVRVLWAKNRTTGEVRTREYLQDSLMAFPKIELYGILGRAVEIVLKSEADIDIATLMQMANPRQMIDRLSARLPGAEDAPPIEGSPENEIDAMKILAALAQVVSTAPQLLKEAFCVILNVPLGHREWAMNFALDNLTDEEMFDILETFIDQSWAAIEGFFTQYLPKMAQRTIQARQRAAEKRRSDGRSTGR